MSEKISRSMLGALSNRSNFKNLNRTSENKKKINKNRRSSSKRKKKKTKRVLGKKKNIIVSLLACLRTSSSYIREIPSKKILQFTNLNKYRKTIVNGL